MKRMSIGVAILTGLLVLGLAAGAFAGNLTGTVRTRLDCAGATGEAITITGEVSEQSWNTLVVVSGAGTYTVRTGPFMTGYGLADLTGRTVTVTGYTGPGANCTPDEAEAVNLVRAQTIAYEDTVIDLTQIPAGGFGGLGAGQGRGRMQQGPGAAGRGGQGTMARDGSCGTK